MLSSRKINSTFFFRGFAVLCGAAALIAGCGAWAAPVETVVYAFEGGRDGNGPLGLISDGSGNLYGTTSSGGGVVDCFGGRRVWHRITAFPGRNPNGAARLRLFTWRWRGPDRRSNLRQSRQPLWDNRIWWRRGLPIGRGPPWGVRRCV